MPFTVSHVAAAAPLALVWRGRLVLSALVIGSMVPDLTLLVPGLFDRDVGRSIGGVVVFCVPAGLLLLALWHTFLKEPVLELLPAAVRRRLVFSARRRRALNVAIVLNAAAAVGAGALTHVLWDSVTHSDGWIVQRATWLESTFTVGGLHVPVYRLLQHGSSLAGLILTAGMFVVWVNRREPIALRERMTVQQRALLRATWLGLTVGFGAIFLRFELAHADSSTVYTTFGRPVVAAMRGFAVA
ncbi:MAG: DUF4184 family protein, partial [Phycisphaerales bacterium]|nr:DUF4184 family protein [Phycisphaerales bacterium]